MNAVDSNFCTEPFILVHVHPQITNTAFNIERSLTKAEWPISPCPGLTVLTMLDELWIQQLENCPSPRKNSPITETVSAGPPDEFTEM